MGKAKKKALPVKKVPVKKVKGGKGKSSFHGKLWLAGLIFVYLLFVTGISFIPETAVPAWARPVHGHCLCVRNTVIARSGLQISRFEDTAVVKPEESPVIRLYLAPSPKIVPALCEFIGSAKTTLDVCIYDLDLREIADALIAAKQTGVHVRMVVDSDNRKLAAVDRAAAAGIPVVEDNRPAIMHNKFVVADARKVWTGSFNFTENGRTLNDNNAVILESPAIAAAYTDKFSEYFGGKFGSAAVRGKPARAFSGKVPVIAAFSPSDGVADEICSQLICARESVVVMAFVLTNDRISKVLGDLSKKGIDVKVLLDRGQANSRFGDSRYLRGCGVQMTISPNTRGKMHHKVIVIDGETVITGSYNFSDSAEKNNDENLIIIKNAELAQLFVREYERCSSGTKGY